MGTRTITYRLLSPARQQPPSLSRTLIPQPCTPHLIHLRRSSTEGLSSTTPPQQPRPLSTIPEPNETAATSPKTSGPPISRVLSRVVIPRQQQRPGPENLNPTDSAAASRPPPRLHISRFLTTAPLHVQSLPRITSTPRIRKRQYEHILPVDAPIIGRHGGTDTGPKLVRTSIANDVMASLHPYQHTYSLLGNFNVKIVPDKRYNVTISRAEPLFFFQEPEGLNAGVKTVRVEDFNGATVGYLPDHMDKFLARVMAARFLTFVGICTGTSRDVNDNIPAMVEVHFTSPWEKEAKTLWKQAIGRDTRRKIKHQISPALTLNLLNSIRSTPIADEITQCLRPPQKIVSYGFFHSSITGTNHFPGNATISTGDALIIQRNNFPKNAIRASTVDGITVGYLSAHHAGCFADYLTEGVLKLEAVVTKLADHDFPHDLPVKIELLGPETRKDELARLFENLERTWNFQRTA